MIIIWCDGMFENDKCYQSMKNEFSETTTATSGRPLDSIDMAVFNEGKEELSSNDVPLVTVRTSDDAIRQIEKNKDKKIFLICSGTVGRYLVPIITAQYFYVHDVYIYTHNIPLNMEWEDQRKLKLKMFNFHTNLLLRLTRDIAYYFIERGKTFLKANLPQNALTCFNHARTLEIRANIREKIQSNSNDNESTSPQPDFRDHLDLLEGDDGLIFQAHKVIRAKEQPLQTNELN